MFLSSLMAPGEKFPWKSSVDFFPVCFPLLLATPTPPRTPRPAVYSGGGGGRAPTGQGGGTDLAKDNVYFFPGAV